MKTKIFVVCIVIDDNLVRFYVHSKETFIGGARGRVIIFFISLQTYYFEYLLLGRVLYLHLREEEGGYEVEHVHHLGLLLEPILKSEVITIKKITL